MLHVQRLTAWALVIALGPIACTRQGSAPEPPASEATPAPAAQSANAPAQQPAAPEPAAHAKPAEPEPTPPSVEPVPSTTAAPEPTPTAPSAAEPKQPAGPASAVAPTRKTAIRTLHPQPGASECVEMYGSCTRGPNRVCTTEAFVLACGEAGKHPKTRAPLRCACP
jgi:outer membrane biosynthesis protein TonB